MPSEAPVRLRLEIRGAVQGVGFRPFVYRLAHELGLAGWVLNDSRGVFLEVEGSRPLLETFHERLPAEKPPRSILHSIETRWLEAAGFDSFVIRHSDESGAKTAVVLPDVATCDDCLAEVLDPGDRRHRYPFTNCTNCGPRFSIVEGLPYDRPGTTMRRFEMCPDCRREYEDPLDRRFHAQPNACPVCGPRLALTDRSGDRVAVDDRALRAAAEAVLRGRILALKGLGGFHLVVDAASEAAVAELRERKRRYERPLALMVPDLDHARDLCRLPEGAEELLRSPQSPIVLLERRSEAAVAEAVAPGNPYLGLMLPYTPLHHLLLRELDRPVVATSGNLSDEPIATGNDEALARLGGIADLFLVHDRPIARHVDDSVVRFLAGEVQPLRRARGLAPLPVRLRRDAPAILAVGAHLKNVVALARGRDVFLSQHIGDMETPEAMAAFERVIRDFLELYEAQPEAVAHDLHPDYVSTRWARDRTAGAAGGGEWGSALAAAPRLAVQHHHAHLAACLAEHGVEGRALGVVWDGTGYGDDGTVWGGEFLLGDARGYRRVARLRPFRLPGGEAAIREPSRTALALLWELEGASALERRDLAPAAGLSEARRRLLRRMLETGLNSPVSTSAGRLFDGAAALAGLRQRVSFEGQAAMELEFEADPDERGAYPFEIADARAGPAGSVLELDWRPLLAALIEDSLSGVAPGIIAARFHNALVGAVVGVARAVGEPRIALTGGCFQNRWLSERSAERLAGAGFEVLIHRRVPPNDGGISLGQVAVAAARLGEESGRERSGMEAAGGEAGSESNRR